MYHSKRHTNIGTVRHIYTMSRHLQPIKPKSNVANNAQTTTGSNICPERSHNSFWAAIAVHIKFNSIEQWLTQRMLVSAVSKCQLYSYMHSVYTSYKSHCHKIRMSQNKINVYTCICSDKMPKLAKQDKEIGRNTSLFFSKAILQSTMNVMS